jgi:diguanylate cyclase (GGDEF)-like protein/PAS domain S-box-containing protein
VGLEFTDPARPRRLTAALVAPRPGLGVRLGSAAAVVVLLVAGVLVVYTTGGTRHPWLHMLYLPVLLAAWGLGPWGGVLTGIAAGLLVGPWMPLDVLTGEAQPAANWLYRLGVFTLVGGFGGVLNGLLRAQLREAQRARRRFAALLDHAPDVILVCDDAWRVREATPAVAAVLGHEPDELVGRRLGELLHPDDRDRWPLLHDGAPAGGAPAETELRLRHRDGTWRHLEVVVSDLRHDPDVGAVVVNARDVSQWRAMEAELRHQAAHDPATGLPNRQRFRDELRAALAPGGTGRPAILLVNLDRFKAINETYGPDTGDRLIAALAKRLARCIGPRDVLARYSGNEFALLCPDVDGASAAGAMAARVLERIREPFLLVSGEVRVQASVGMALADGGVDPADLISDAYTALRHAKRLGGNRHALYRPAWGARARSALRTEHALHGVLERGELELYYQPVVALDTELTVGVEALVRWQHPQLGTVAPSDFVPIAEQTGSIAAIGRWVLGEACRQVAAWRRQVTGGPLNVAVNLSPVQLEDPALIDDVLGALEAGGIQPAALTLEITETALLHDPEHAVDMLLQLKDVGVCIAVDDFGTGYSSLGLLHHLPVDRLKIDRLFTRQLGSGTADDTIVSAVVALGHTLGLETVAEGVETRAQAASLARLGCRYAQGFLYARPAPADRVTPLLSRTGRLG